MKNWSKLNNTPIGKCSRCGGVVSIPTIWWSIQRPVPRCEQCDATAKAHGLPVIETESSAGEYPKGVQE